MECYYTREKRELRRDRQHACIAGVCSGLARYLGFNRYAIRCLFVLALLCGSFATLVAYFIAAMVMRPGLDDNAYVSQPPPPPGSSTRHDPSRYSANRTRYKLSELERRLRSIERNITDSGSDLKQKIDSL